ncbi:hypothetical protein IJJ08_01615 [bacterium]|nr:hypothetical protein [bacterium]
MAKSNRRASGKFLGDPDESLSWQDEVGPFFPWGNQSCSPRVVVWLGLLLVLIAALAILLPSWWSNAVFMTSN